jgi:phosphohistidine phosphatase SixA
MSLHQKEIEWIYIVSYPNSTILLVGHDPYLSEMISEIISDEGERRRRLQQQQQRSSKPPQPGPKESRVSKN